MDFFKGLFNFTVPPKEPEQDVAEPVAGDKPKKKPVASPGQRSTIRITAERPTTVHDVVLTLGEVAYEMVALHEDKANREWRAVIKGGAPIPREVLAIRKMVSGCPVTISRIR